MKSIFIFLIVLIILFNIIHVNAYNNIIKPKYTDSFLEATEAMWTHNSNGYPVDNDGNCKGGRHCPFNNGVCCKDTCCPHGYTCGSDGKTCHPGNAHTSSSSSSNKNNKKSNNDKKKNTLSGKLPSNDKKKSSSSSSSSSSKNNKKKNDKKSNNNNNKIAPPVTNKNKAKEAKDGKKVVTSNKWRPKQNIIIVKNINVLTHGISQTARSDNKNDKRNNDKPSKNSPKSNKSSSRRK